MIEYIESADFTMIIIIIFTGLYIITNVLEKKLEKKNK